MAGACAECKRPNSSSKWGPNGGVCYPCWKALGKPVRPASGKVGPSEPVLDEGVPLQLAAVRAAGHWAHEELPQHPVVQTWVAFRRKSPREFLSTWERLEKEHAEVSKPVPRADVPGSDEERVECGVTSRIVAEMEAWLEKKRVAALQGASGILRGERR